MMEGFGVILEYSQPKIKGSESISCSGLYLGNGFILTHGTILIDILKSKPGKGLLQEVLKKGFVHCEEEVNLIDQALKSTCSEFQVIFPLEHQRNKKQKQKLPLKHAKEGPGLFQSSVLSANPKNEIQKTADVATLDKLISSCSSDKKLMRPGYSSYPASVVMVFIQHGVNKSLGTIMPSSQGWKLTEDKDENLTVQFERFLLSSFVLLRVTNGSENEVHQERCKELMHTLNKILYQTSKVHKGSSVFVESSPFGSLSPSIFLNSLSFGIVSNVCGSSGELLLTDARCIMGSEGAPVFSDSKRHHLCGFIISPFCWRQGEWLGLTLMASAESVLTTLKSYLKPETGNSSLEVVGNPEAVMQNDICCKTILQSSYSTSNEDTILLRKGLNEGFATVLDQSVVAVQCGSGWGSGVIVSRSPGIVLTCAHVVTPARNEIVKIVLSDGRSLHGHIIFKTRPASAVSKNEENWSQGSSVWDLAVIETIDSLPSSLPLATDVPQNGSPVVVAGHGVFSPSCLPTPSLSRGIVSKSISFPVKSLLLPKHSFANRDPDFSDKTTLMKKLGDSRLPRSDVAVAYTHQPLQLHNKEKHCKKSFADHWLTSQKDDQLVPLILQTTCAVYAGTSGGPVVSLHPKNGLQIMGIVVCNTQDTSNKATFPHINLAVPAPALKKVVEDYIASGDKNVLRYLDVESTAASQLWALGVMPKSNL